nr:A24 family peptidase [uncultured Cetobacterium sp.]
MDRFIILNFLLIILLLSVVICDMKNREIPNTLTIFLIVLGIIYGILNLNIEKSILGGCVYSTPFWMIYGYGSDLLNRECLGFGDIKLIFALGLFLGKPTIIDILLYMNLTFIIPSILVGIYFIFKKKLIKEIPLAPFLIFSFFIKILLRGYI